MAEDIQDKVSLATRRDKLNELSDNTLDDSMLDALVAYVDNLVHMSYVAGAYHVNITAGEKHVHFTGDPHIYAGNFCKDKGLRL